MMDSRQFMEKGTANVTIEEYMQILSSAEPVPGGGGASGMVAATAASLGAMVCNLTIGKKKYAEVEAEVTDILHKCESLRDRLLVAADRDAECFKPLSEAYGLPKDTDEEKAHRDEVLESCLKVAAEAPLEMMETITELLRLLDRLGDIGSRLAISDVGVAAYMAKACSYTASLNVFINTKLMKNREEADRINARAMELIGENDSLGTGAFYKVWKGLKPENCQ